MPTVNPYLWAKKSEKYGRYFWLPLNQHLEDTLRVSERLWELWLNNGQRQLIIDSLSEPSEAIAKQLVQFLAAVHDCGKNSVAFQIKKGFPYELDLRLLERLEKGGFIGISRFCLPSSKESPHALAGQAMLSWRGFGDDIGTIIGAHHGKPVDYKKQYENQSAYTENYFQEESSNKNIYQKWKSSQDDLIQWALEASGFLSPEDLPKVSQSGQAILSGLLIMADWIASNEEYFPLIEIDDMEVEDQETRFLNGWKKWFKSYQWEANYYSDPKELYAKRFRFDEPRNVQQSLSDVIEQSDDPGIYVLEAPMGIGKTEAALVGVEQLARKTGRSGLFFGLPTQATSNGIFPRINVWLKSIQEELGDNLPIRLAHGKAALNEEFTSLARNINIDAEENGSVFVNEWFSGRKTTALDDFVVGTVDQFLLLALKQKHLSLRHLGFSKKIVVIDEVHSYDVYMGQYLQRALQWMGAYGVPVIVLSATLAADMRKKLIDSYIRGKGSRVNKNQNQEKVFQTDAYPLITYTDGDQVKQVLDFEKTENQVVTVEKVAEEDFYQLIDALSEHNGIIGIIVNTVKRAQKLAKYCVAKYGDDKVELLHSNFIAQDRVKKENNLINMIGKGAERPKQKIIIGTQVIEQSLDIDFDVLISDLAPMDLLLQRVGRLHRHKIIRPTYHEKPCLYIIGASEQLEFEEGAKHVYGGYLLARTQYFLSNSLMLPNDISPLVQKVYGSGEIELQTELQDKYNKMKQDSEDLLKKKELKAKKFRIDRPAQKTSRKKTLIGWLNLSVADQGEERAYAQVRDSNETIEVIALKKTENGYGIFGKGVNLSSQIDNLETSKEIAQQTLRLPYALSSPPKIDTTIKDLETENLRHLKDWQDHLWLRGSLGIVFDEHNQYRLNGYLLTYDTKYGLTYEKE
ncbi:CRISPR-associated helicase Cas3' [Proteinivorax tanatarense]|uniref:CRISPR-associated helicase Cas3 n=1 Tax=Proteinivorax tanatarense TaxID=1260629 RepID=A0AAU7VSV7_9FIRM